MISPNNTIRSSHRLLVCSSSRAAVSRIILMPPWKFFSQKSEWNSPGMNFFMSYLKNWNIIFKTKISPFFYETAITISISSQPKRGARKNHCFDFQFCLRSRTPTKGIALQSAEHRVEMIYRVSTRLKTRMKFLGDKWRYRYCFLLKYLWLLPSKLSSKLCIERCRSQNSIYISLLYDCNLF